jgi:hypothetical protein
MKTKLLETLEDLIERAPRSTMHSRVECITPAIAEKYLDKIPSHQRRIRPRLVDFLTRSIEQGSFQLTHQGICFDVRGALIDGQHRLTAIVKANKPVEMMVTRDVPVNTWQCLDIGANRNLSDVTGIDKKITEPIRYILRLIHIVTPTYKDVDLIANSRIGDALKRLITLCPTSRKLFSASKIKSMAALRSAMAGNDYALNQYRALVLQDYSGMTPYIQSMCKQFVDHGSVAEKQSEMVCRAYVAFDDMSYKKTKIVINDYHPILEDIRKEIKKIIQ